jgi:hypothetical protein
MDVSRNVGRDVNISGQKGGTNTTGAKNDNQMTESKTLAFQIFLEKQNQSRMVDLRRKNEWVRKPNDLIDH